MESLVVEPRRPSRRQRRAWVAAALVALTMTTTLVAPGSAEAAAEAKHGAAWTPPNTPRIKAAPVPRAAVPAARPRRAPGGAPAFHARRTALPSAGVTSVALPSRAATAAKAAAPIEAGSSPVYLASADGTPAQVDVRWPGADKARSAGVRTGLMWGLAGHHRVNVQLDDKILDGTAGGALASRVRLVALPACALTTPAVAACERQTAVKTTTDAATGRLTAAVDLTSATMVLAAQSVPAGSAGTYAATPTSPSNNWSQGGATGGFDYSYPITLPASLGGAAPDVSLDYSSQSVDGQTAATNNQSSWIGDGWSYDPGYIERSYQSCDKDGITGSADQCWADGGFEVSLNQAGIGGTLVHDDGSAGWRVSGDDGASVKLVTGGANGAYQGEYWVVTEQDGTRLYYGAGHLPAAEGGAGHDPATNSAWTEPVYCPKSADPCYNSSSGTSSYATDMAYRWNLDFAVDPHGNTTVYSYDTEPNYYGRGSAHTPTRYVRGGYLKQINYGWRTGDVAGGTAKSAAEVVFTTGQRCSGSATECSSYSNLKASTATDWPDTPFDLICQSTGTCDNWVPSFFSTYALTRIQTLINKSGTLTPVDTYALNNTMLDPGDSTGSELWLNSITHTGNDGAAVSLPSVTFTPFQYANRVPNSGTWPDYWHPRIVAITDETGAETSISYTTSTPAVRACSQSPTSPVLPSPATDDMLCYQQFWWPPDSTGTTPNADWFEKYVVSQISVTSLVDTTPARTYTYAYSGSPAWHRDDSPLTPSDQRTWNDFRGFGKVTTTSGAAPDPITQTTTTYLRGMDGDHTGKTGTGTRSVTVADSAGDSVTDADQYADTELETDTYDHAGGTPIRESIQLPWSAQTASHAEKTPADLPGATAYFTGTGTALDRQLLADGTWRTSKQVNTFSATTGLLQRTDRQGDTSLVNKAGSQETCTTNTYATPPSSGLNTAMVDYPARSVTVAVATGGPVGAAACPAPTATNTLADTLTSYDGNTGPGAIKDVGDVSRTQVLDHYDGTSPAYVTSGAGLAFDDYGRATSVSDARGLVTDTTYTPPQAGQLPTTVASTVPDYHLTTTTTLDQARQLTTKTVDPNGNTTTASYDGLGRLLNVWEPGRTVAQPANIAYTYKVNGSTGPSWTETRNLRDNSSYAYAFTILNGFGQTRQTQSLALDGANGSVITDTFYDSHGWPVKATNPYPTTAFPSSTVYPASDDKVPGETLTSYDGVGRPTVGTFYAKAQPQWKNTTAYPGADRTDVVPAAGGTPTSTFTDALGRTSARWDYTTATATGNAADARPISYAYDPAGRVTTVTGPTGEHWTTTYDLRGNAVQRTDPDAGTSSTTYYPDGDPQTTTDSTGRQLSYAYDTMGRKTQLYSGAYAATPPASDVLATWTYDTAAGGKGQPATATSYTGGSGPDGIAYTDAIAGYTNQYGPTGTSLTVPGNVPVNQQALAGTYTTTETYLPISGRPSTVKYTEPTGSPLPSETVTDTYDVNGNLNNVAGLADYQTSATYDQMGNPLTANLGDAPDQVAVTTNYDPSTGGPVERFIDKQTGATHVDDITAYRDAAGQTLAVRDVQDGANTDLQCYGFDGLGELVNAWTDKGGVTTSPDPSVPGIGHCATQATPATTPTAGDLGGPAPYWQSYAYNAAGDRTGETDHDVSGNTADDVTHSLHYTGSGPDELSDEQHGTPGNQATDSYTYYADGSTRTRAVAGQAAQTFAYDAQGLTGAVTDSAGNSSNYTYDASGGLLLESVVSGGHGTVTLYLSGEQLSLDTGSGRVTGTRTYGLAADAAEIRTGTGSLSYEFGNGQNTDSLLITADAAQTETRRAFTPYGVARETAAAWIDNRAFLNQPADPVAGINLLGARAYDPAAGRFLQIDPLLDTTDPTQLGGYTYAGNDPVDQADAAGQSADFCATLSCAQATAGGVGCTDCESGSIDAKYGASIDKRVLPHLNKKKLAARARQVDAQLRRSGQNYGATADEDMNAGIQTGVVHTGTGLIGILSGDDKVQKKLNQKWNDDVLQQEGIDQSSWWFKGGEIYGAFATAAIGGPEDGEIAAADLAEFGAEDEGAISNILSKVGCSFDRNTPVLMADGTTKPIKAVKVGDQVQATDPQTDRTAAKAVTKLHDNVDTDLADLTVADEHGTRAVLHTTQNHPFWDATTGTWTRTDHLKAGDRLHSPGSAVVTVVSVSAFAHRQHMYNLTVADIHTFYVLAGGSPVLVHNSGGCLPVLRNWTSKRFQFGNETFLLDKKAMEHILVRHHPEYWDGSEKALQSFFDPKASVGDIEDAIGQVMRQNRDTLIQRGANGTYQIRGTVNGTKYVLGVNRGRVAQFYAPQAES